MWPAARECLLMKVSRGERKSLSPADAPALGSGLVSRQTGAYLRHAVCPRSLLRKCLDEALDVFRDRFVFLRRSQFRQHVGVCEHVEAERSGERSALNAEPADVLCGRLLNAESEEVPGGEGLKVFDFLHDVQAIKKPPA